MVCSAMEVLQKAYGYSSEDSEEEDYSKKRPRLPSPEQDDGKFSSPLSLDVSSSAASAKQLHEDEGGPPPSLPKLPPPPADLVNQLNSSLPWIGDVHRGRIRNFPHVEGNFALHVYIPVAVSLIVRRQLEPVIEKAFAMAPDLETMVPDVPIYATHSISKNVIQAPKLAKEYHISLSRTIPIRIHQIGSIVPMLRHKFASQKRYWMELDQWEVFVNDDQTCTFLSLEVVAKGLPEICSQIHSVNEVLRLHNLPVFYEDPRPHISVAWTLGNARESLMNVVEEFNALKKMCAGSQNAPIWSHLFSRVDCKIGSQTYCIWKAAMQPKDIFA